MRVMTTTTRQYLDEEPKGFTRHKLDEEGRMYEDVSQTTGFNRDFYVNVNHIVSIESAAKEGIECTRIVLSTGEEFATLTSVSECLKMIQL